MYQPIGFAQTIFNQRYAITETETFAEACKRAAAATREEVEGRSRALSVFRGCSGTLAVSDIYCTAIHRRKQHPRLPPP